MTTDMERAASREAHAGSARSSLDAARKKWRDAEAGTDEKKNAALMVIANTGPSYDALAGIVGDDEATRIRDDAGMNDKAESP